MAHRIERVHLTPVAFRDPPLLNTVGVHQPWALRTVVEIVTDSGLSGLGETYGDARHLTRLRAAAHALTGLDVWRLHELRTRVAAALTGDDGRGGHGMSGMVTGSGTAARVVSPFEVACLDVQGKAICRPVSDLLGGAVRDQVDFSGYLFYKWAGHPGAEADEWGAALDPDGIVAQARRMVDRYGFTALKLKGGVLPPREEVAAVTALAAAFPGHALRLDPNAAWRVDTALDVATALDGVLDYLEDPTPGIAGMARVARHAPMPLATNMCVVAPEHLAPAAEQGAVDIVLSDHHFWGGLTGATALAATCRALGLSLSMHSNSHLGISLAAMTHLAAATPDLTHACDTHWPWKGEDEDVVVPGALRFDRGSVALPTGPGLGVELDRDALARHHERYLACGITERDDTGYYRTAHPGFDPSTPRW